VGGNIKMMLSEKGELDCFGFGFGLDQLFCFCEHSDEILYQFMEDPVLWRLQDVYEM
jgi:hypothetical protein